MKLHRRLNKLEEIFGSSDIPKRRIFQVSYIQGDAKREKDEQRIRDWLAENPDGEVFRIEARASTFVRND